ncbi:hypothetical protein ACFVW5_16015 [Streptomyces sp. NPDC058232]|uniref:hypothetical protein n=1 Tax=Streptomyces sp. NPDC058232 TaxID=3346393 RepID=UPI0036E9B08C
MPRSPFPLAALPDQGQWWKPVLVVEGNRSSSGRVGPSTTVRMPPPAQQWEIPPARGGRFPLK